MKVNFYIAETDSAHKIVCADLYMEDSFGNSSSLRMMRDRAWEPGKYTWFGRKSGLETAHNDLLEQEYQRWLLELIVDGPQP
jgi:hypothetical protein